MSSFKGPCPCTSGRDYKQCCAPYHAGGEPPDCSTLVRSRFSAFALGDGEYLYRTLHPDHDDRAHARPQMVAALKASSRELKFRKLTILDEPGVDADGCTRVRFEARIFRKGADASFTETSRFLHDGTGWRYLDGVIEKA